MDSQTNRYFVAIICFAVVATWLSAGFFIAVVSLVAALIAMQTFPALMSRRGRGHGRMSPARRGDSKRRRTLVTTRPLADEDEYQLVPDEPSLILSVSE